MRRGDVLIIGAGAAGLFCAIEAGRRGRRVIVLEHNSTVGKKIRISGGGRCNFTNIYAAPENYISANPHFCKSALARYQPSDFIALVEKHRIKYHEKKLGQLFCDGSAQQIIDMLLMECERAGAEILCQCKVQRVMKDEHFIIETDKGKFISESLVVATGGLSVPPLGATDFGYALARQFGLKIIETRPALVPFVFAPQKLEALKSLSGISVDASVSCRNVEFRENILLTHRGLSGPAVLQISSYWRHGDEITIDLLPQTDIFETFKAKHASDIELSNLLAQFLPRRFAQAWCALYAPSRPLRNFSEAELAAIAERIHQWKLKPDGTEGYRKAEVTAGGVSTDELSSKTMEAKKVSGLFFIGEVVDVTGQLGGYNFQWAWSSAYAAGQFV